MKRNYNRTGYKRFYIEFCAIFFYQLVVKFKFVFSQKLLAKIFHENLEISSFYVYVHDISMHLKIILCQLTYNKF